MEEDLNSKRLYLDDPIFPFYRNRKDLEIRLSNNNIEKISKKRSYSETCYKKNRYENIGSEKKIT